jgi:proline iminopeptidase
MDGGPSPTGEGLLATCRGVFWTAIGGEGPPALLLHGGPGAYDYLEPLAAMIADRARTVRFDQRGCWRTPARGPYTLADAVEDVLALADACAAPVVDLVAHSWGCNLALAVATRHPARVRRLALLSTFCVLGAGDQAAYRAARLERLDPEQRTRWHALEAARAAGREDAGLRAERAALALAADIDAGVPREQIPVFAGRVDAAINATLMADTIACGSDPAFRAALATLPHPALVLHGERDPRPLASAEALARLLPLGRFRAITGAGHYPWLERPDTVANSLRDLLG